MFWRMEQKVVWSRWILWCLQWGYRNYDPLSQEIKVFAKEVFVIGDSVRARRAMDATKEAFETAMMI